MLAPWEVRPTPSDPSVEGHVSWFLGQSWLIILLSFLLGLILGWALWRRPWHKRYFTESEAITRVTREHSVAVADHAQALTAKDEEISRLQGLLAGATAAGTTAAVAATDTSADEAAATSSQIQAAADVAPDEAAVPDVEPTPVIETAESIDVAEVDAPVVDVHEHGAHGVDVTEVATPSVDVADDATASAQVSGPASDTAIEDGPETAPIPTAAIAAEAPAPAESSEHTETTDGTEAGVQAAEAPAVQPLVDATAGEAPAESEDDDLERVEGIGPRIAAALRASGITTFRALADSDVASLQSALEAAGLRFAPSLPTWARQSRLLADGDEDGFLQLTEQLVGGRDIGRRA